MITPVHRSVDPPALDHATLHFAGSPGFELRLSAGALRELVDFAVARLGVPYPLDQGAVTALHDVRDNLHVLAEGDDVGPLRETLTALLAGRPR